MLGAAARLHRGRSSTANPLCGLNPNHCRTTMSTRAKKVAWIAGAIIAIWVGVVALALVVAEIRAPVSLPRGAKPTVIASAYVTVDGTWVIEGGNQAFPVQTSKIFCERHNSRCTEATAQIQNGQLRVILESYEIIRWTSTQIVYTTDAPQCVNYIYTIDLATEAVSGRRVRSENETCRDVEENLRLSLVDGLPLSIGWSRDAIPWYGRVAMLPFRLLLGGN